MPATPAPSVPDLRAPFEGVLASMTSEEAQRVRARFPDAPLVLDLIQATEPHTCGTRPTPARRGAAVAHAVGQGAHLVPPPPPRRRPRRRRAADVGGDLAALAEEAERTATQAKVLRAVAAYLARTAPSMDDATYLAQGWPIATGVIEGACRHLVKDRCERSGRRWTIAGAAALLHLRCMRTAIGTSTTPSSGASATSGSTRPPTPTTWCPRSPSTPWALEPRTAAPPALAA